MSGCAHDIHARGRYTAKERDQNAPVVWAELHFHDGLRSDAEDDNDTGDNAEDDGDIDEHLGFVAHRDAAGCVGGIFGDCIRSQSLYTVVELSSLT